MSSFAHELLTIDRERVDLRAGLLGLVVVSMFGLAIAVVGTVAMAATIGAFVVLATDPPPAGCSWATALPPLASGGDVLSAIRIGDRARPPTSRRQDARAAQLTSVVR